MPISSAARSREREIGSRHRILADLLAMDYADFAKCCADLFTRMGYKDVHIVPGRAGRRGAKNANGGYDLEMRDAIAGGKVIVQLKQYPAGTAIFLRQYDELLGTAVRTGASEAILLTTGSFSPLALAQQKGRPARISGAPRMRLMDGDILAALIAGMATAIRPIIPRATNATNRKLPAASRQGSGGAMAAPPAARPGTPYPSPGSVPWVIVTVHLRVEPPYNSIAWLP